jgi:hypothetical protein
MALGVNIGAVNYYSTGIIFNDAMKCARDGWDVVTAGANPTIVSGVPEPPLDANGYPIGLGTLTSLGDALNTFAFSSNGSNYPAGVYSLIFDGKGTVGIAQGGGSYTSVTQAGGLGTPNSINVTPSGFGINISIVASDPIDYVRNIRLIMPGYLATYQQQPFYTPYLQQLAPFSTLRFMDTMRTNNQPITDWSQRTTPAYLTQAKSTGMAVEYMVAMANATSENMWVNMPYQADDAYVSGFAQYVHDNLNPGLKVYVEYGNEDWNTAPAFAQGYAYIDAYATTNNLNHDQATADLAAHDWALWATIFGNQTGSTFLRVAANQFGDPWHLDQEIQRLVADASPSDPDHGFDVVSGAPYFSPDPTNYTSATTTAQIVADTDVSAVTPIDAQAAAFVNIRNKWQRKLGQTIPAMMYEGGYGLTPGGDPTVPWYQAYLSTQTDPGMYQVTQDFLDGLRQNGIDGINYYDFVYKINVWGPWGALQATGQPAAHAPIYAALSDYSTGVMTLPTTTALSVSGLGATSTAGATQTITVTALGTDGTTATDYLGTVHFKSSDPQAVLPPDYLFTRADQGVHTFTIALDTVGNRSITVTDDANAAITGTEGGDQVTSAGAASVTISGFPAIPSATAGVAQSFTVTAYDTFGNVADGYTGAVHFTSTDPKATLPADYAFTAADGGQHTFAVTLGSAGTRSLTVTDTVNTWMTALEGPIVVTPGALGAFRGFPFPASFTAGVASPFTLTALDTFGNPIPTYTGTVHFTSTDPNATLPADYTFTAADAGVHAFTATMFTAGSQMLTFGDQAAAVSNSLMRTINPGTASKLKVMNWPTPTPAGASRKYFVRAYDAYGNLAPSYTGTVHLTSSDPQAMLSPDYTFTAADAGSHSFSAVLETAGKQLLTATDVAMNAMTGTQTGINITPGALAGFVVAPAFAAAPTGSPTPFQVIAQDAFGNQVTGYTGQVHFTSSDPQAALPANYAFTAADGGTHPFSATLSATGNQTVTIKDTTTGIVVNLNVLVTTAGAAGASQLVPSSVPPAPLAGVPWIFTLTAASPLGATVSGYRDTVHFTSTDPQAILPADYTFTAADAGKHAFIITLKTAGAQSIAFSDTTNGPITGKASNVTVAPVQTTNMTFSALPSAWTAGTAQQFTVTALDPYGNIAVGYAGTIHFTATDTQAALPADYTFTAGDAGVHTFSVALKTAGTQAFRARDTVHTTITTVTTGLAVAPAVLSTLAITGVTSPITTGTHDAFTVTAIDAYGNLETGYTGTVHFTSNDTHAGLPADYTFTAADAGKHAFYLTFGTSGTQAFRARDTVHATYTALVSVTVVALPAQTLVITALPNPVIAGAMDSFTVTARDTNGNVATGYTGTVHFTSVDLKATLPADYTFTAMDGGTHVFSVVFGSTSVQTITATDTLTPTLTSTGRTWVYAGAMASLSVYMSSTTVAGVVQVFSVKALDAYGNTATGYTGTVQVTSSDLSAVLPAAYTFQAANAGLHTFSVTLLTLGPVQVTATDQTSAVHATATTQVSSGGHGVVVGPAVPQAPPVSLPDPLLGPRRSHRHRLPQPRHPGDHPHGPRPPRTSHAGRFAMIERRG